MSKDRSPMIVREDDGNALMVWLQDAVRQVRLAWRLLWDERVPVWTKLIPPAALVYVLFPVDIIPDVVLGLGQLDDIAVLLIGLKLFIEMAPPDVVREHLVELGARIKEWRVVEGEEGESSVVIEGQYELKGPETEEAEAAEAEPISD
jgi:uncharacterized membrane protein YkvA (DUF1232 family)